MQSVLEKQREDFDRINDYLLKIEDRFERSREIKEELFQESYAKKKLKADKELDAKFEYCRQYKIEEEKKSWEKIMQ